MFVLIMYQQQGDHSWVSTQRSLPIRAVKEGLCDASASQQGRISSR